MKVWRLRLLAPSEIIQEGLHALPAIGEGDEWRHTRLRKRPYRQTRNDPIDIRQRVCLKDEADCNSPNNRTASQDLLLGHKLFGARRNAEAPPDCIHLPGILPWRAERVLNELAGRFGDGAPQVNFLWQNRWSVG